MGRSERDENTQIDRETKSSGHELILRERVLAAGGGPLGGRGKRGEVIARMMTSEQCHIFWQTRRYAMQHA